MGEAMVKSFAQPEKSTAIGIRSDGDIVMEASSTASDEENILHGIDHNKDDALISYQYQNHPVENKKTTMITTWNSNIENELKMSAVAVEKGNQQYNQDQSSGTASQSTVLTEPSRNPMLRKEKNQMQKKKKKHHHPRYSSTQKTSIPPPPPHHRHHHIQQQDIINSAHQLLYSSPDDEATDEKKPALRPELGGGGEGEPKTPPLLMGRKKRNDSIPSHPTQQRIVKRRTEKQQITRNVLNGNERTRARKTRGADIRINE